MSWQATAYVSELTTTPSGERLTRSEKLLALLLANRHNPDYDIAWPSVARLADEAMMSVRMVQYCLKSLEKKGVITIERRWFGPSQCDTNVYRFPGLPSRGGGATIAPGKMSTPAIRLHQGGAETLHQGGALMVAPKPAVNQEQTESAESLEQWEETWKRQYDGLYGR